MKLFEHKLREPVSPEVVLEKLEKLNFHTDKIFGKFGTVQMCSGENFFKFAKGKIDKTIDNLPTKEVPMDKIFPTQDTVSEDKIKAILTGRQNGKDDLPFLIHNKLGYFIFDGHNRLSISKIRGEKIVKAKVYEDK